MAESDNSQTTDDAPARTPAPGHVQAYPLASVPGVRDPRLPEGALRAAQKPAIHPPPAAPGDTQRARDTAHASYVGTSAHAVHLPHAFVAQPVVTMVAQSAEKEKELAADDNSTHTPTLRDKYYTTMLKVLSRDDRRVAAKLMGVSQRLSAKDTSAKVLDYAHSKALARGIPWHEALPPFLSARLDALGDNIHDWNVAPPYDPANVPKSPADSTKPANIPFSLQEFSRLIDVLEDEVEGRRILIQSGKAYIEEGLAKDRRRDHFWMSVVPDKFNNLEWPYSSNGPKSAGATARKTPPLVARSAEDLIALFRDSLSDFRSTCWRWAFSSNLKLEHFAELVASKDGNGTTASGSKSLILFKAALRCCGDKCKNRDDFLSIMITKSYVCEQRPAITTTETASVTAHLLNSAKRALEDPTVGLTTSKTLLQNPDDCITVIDEGQVGVAPAHEPQLQEVQPQQMEPQEAAPQATKPQATKLQESGQPEPEQRGALMHELQGKVTEPQGSSPLTAPDEGGTSFSSDRKARTRSRSRARSAKPKRKLSEPSNEVSVQRRTQRSKPGSDEEGQKNENDMSAQPKPVLTAQRRAHCSKSGGDTEEQELRQPEQPNSASSAQRLTKRSRIVSDDEEQETEPLNQSKTGSAAQRRTAQRSKIVCDEEKQEQRKKSPTSKENTPPVKHSHTTPENRTNSNDVEETEPHKNSPQTSKHRHETTQPPTRMTLRRNATRQARPFQGYSDTGVQEHSPPSRRMTRRRGLIEKHQTPSSDEEPKSAIDLGKSKEGRQTTDLLRGDHPESESPKGGIQNSSHHIARGPEPVDENVEKESSDDTSSEIKLNRRQRRPIAAFVREGRNTASRSGAAVGKPRKATAGQLQGQNERRVVDGEQLKADAEKVEVSEKPNPQDENNSKRNGEEKRPCEKPRKVPLAGKVTLAPTSRAKRPASTPTKEAKRSKTIIANQKGPSGRIRAGTKDTDTASVSDAQSEVPSNGSQEENSLNSTEEEAQVASKSATRNKAGWVGDNAIEGKQEQRERPNHREFQQLKSEKAQAERDKALVDVLNGMIDADAKLETRGFELDHALRCKVNDAMARILDRMQ